MFFQESAGALVAARLLTAVAASSLGAAVAVSVKKISHLGLCVLISFAAGALLAVTALDLIPESVEIVGLARGTFSVLSGYALFFILTRFVNHVCPACSATHTEHNFSALSITMVIALSVHSLMDGLAIYSASLPTHSAGYLVLFAVAFHKFPEGMALTLVAMNSGINRLSAFLISFSVEAATTIAGGAAGALLHFSEHSPWVGYALGHVGGGFLFLVWHALLSEVVKHHPKHTIVAAALGAGCIAILQQFHAH